MAKPQPINLLQQEVQTLKEQVGQFMEEVRVLRERVEHGPAEEQDHSLGRELAELKKAMERRDADLDREREKCSRLEAKLSDCNAELDREREQRCSVEAELKERLREELRQTVEQTSIDQNPQYKDIVKQFRVIRGRSDNEKTFYAAKFGYTVVMKFLIDMGINIDVRDINDWTPLHHAVSVGHLETVQLLVDRGAHVCAKINNEITPLHIAAKKGHKEVCRVLLSARAQVNQYNDKSAYTSLHYAAENGHMPVVQLLLQHGADVNANWGLSACDLAMRGGHTDVAACLTAAQQ